jgi:predicted transcriptional regulator
MKMSTSTQLEKSCLTPGEIKQWRQLLGWSVQDLAQQANISVGIVSEVEGGHIVPRRQYRPIFVALSVAIEEERKRILKLAEEIRQYCPSH